MSGSTTAVVCIECPRSCRLEVVAGGGDPVVSGHGCKRGVAYGQREVTNPTRTLTTTVRTRFAHLPRLPVRTAGEIPKGAWREAMRALREVCLERPVKTGDVVLADLLGLGVAVIATADLRAVGEEPRPAARHREETGEALLAIDCGTQSLRALVFDAQGRLLAREKVEYEPYFSSAPGWAEQDPEVWFSALVQACRRLGEREPALMARVQGVGVTTQRDTLVCLDRAGDVLRPAILWLDQRRATPAYRPGRLVSAALEAVGVGEALARSQESNRVAWIQEHEPEVWARTDQVVQVSGFLNRRLCGERLDSVASQVGHLPFDYRRQEWAGPLQLNGRLFAIPRERLPGLVPPGTTLGRLTAQAASATGLRAGLPVIACGSDKGCETLGMGVLDTSLASLSFGTTATVQTTSARYFEPLSFMPAYPALVPGQYNPEVEIFRGYWMITWFKKQFAHEEVLEAGRRNLVPERMLDELLASTPPGAMGLVMQPYWCPGLKNPSAKGALIGFGDVHTRAHVYRAIIEGLAFGLRDGLEALEARGRFRTTRLTVSGGASQSDEICQIAADVLERPLVRGVTFETSGLGAAMAVAAGLGLHRSVPAASAAMKAYQYEFQPRPAASAVYRELYSRVYRRMDEALAPLYRDTREIVNYPERRGRA